MAQVGGASSAGTGRSDVRMAGDALLTIGTRGSPLALAQAYETRRRLGEQFDELKAEGAVAIQVGVMPIMLFWCSIYICSCTSSSYE